MTLWISANWWQFLTAFIASSKLQWFMQTFRPRKRLKAFNESSLPCRQLIRRLFSSVPMSSSITLARAQWDEAKSLCIFCRWSLLSFFRADDVVMMWKLLWAFIASCSSNSLIDAPFSMIIKAVKELQDVLWKNYDGQCTTLVNEYTRKWRGLVADSRRFNAATSPVKENDTY